MTRGSVITIGNFDGVHRGHRAILQHARELAQKLDAVTLAVTLEPPPESILKPGVRTPRLMSPQRKVQTLRAVGADDVVVLKTTAQLLSLEPEQFIEQMMREHQPLAFVEGPDFRFGHKRAGDVTLMRRIGENRGFKTVVVPPVNAVLTDQLWVPVRSSLVRWLVGLGRVADAAICLAEPFGLSGAVVKGEQRGRIIQTPTANLDPAAWGDLVLPADGVYAGAVELEDRSRFPAAISVGFKPTFGSRQRVIEAYLLDFQGDLYHRNIHIAFHRWLRDQQVFPSLEALREQLGRDINQIRRMVRQGLLQTTRPLMNQEIGIPHSS